MHNKFYIRLLNIIGQEWLLMYLLYKNQKHYHKISISKIKHLKHYEIYKSILKEFKQLAKIK